MSWIPSSFKTSMAALLGSAMSDDDPHPAFQLEDIRQTMLDTLDHAGWNTYSYLEHRIMFASSLMDLWFLRSDLMHAISNVLGESVAAQTIREISAMFDGLLPKGLASRPSPLMSN
jgi:hypothetical protein